MFGKPGRRRARDGHQLLTASRRRSVRKRGGLSARQQKKIVKARRRYKNDRK